MHKKSWEPRAAVGSCISSSTTANAIAITVIATTQRCSGRWQMIGSGRGCPRSAWVTVSLQIKCSKIVRPGQCEQPPGEIKSSDSLKVVWSLNMLQIREDVRGLGLCWAGARSLFPAFSQHEEVKESCSYRYCSSGALALLPGLCSLARCQSSTERAQGYTGTTLTSNELTAGGHRWLNWKDF